VHLLREGWTLSSRVSRKRSSPTADLRLLSGGISLNKTLANTLLPVRLQWAARSQECKALVDSGAEGNFLDFSFAKHLHIPIITLDHRISVKALNGQSLPSVTHSTTPITFITSGNHTERILFFSQTLP